MLEKVKHIFKLSFRKTNFKAFFFFLIFSIIIWVLVQFSKQYQQVVDVPVYFNNIPKDKIIEESKTDLQLRVTGDGFHLGGFLLSSPSLTIDLDKLPFDKAYIYYALDKEQSKIERKLELNFENVSFLEKKLKIPYQQKEVKKIKVEPIIQVSYAPGYASNGFFKIQPDSVKVSGTKKALDTLTQIKTKTVNFKNIKQDLTGEIPLNTSAYKALTFYADAVHYSLDVEKFTEGRIAVPIDVMNAPKGKKLTIFPKKIMVIFKVSLANYNAISKANFRVVCDFKDLQDDQNFLIPRLIEKPKTITSYRLNVNKVQFVIKK